MIYHMDNRAIDFVLFTARAAYATQACARAGKGGTSRGSGVKGVSA